MKIERKLIVIGLALLLTAIGSAWGAYRTITSTNDNYTTFIRTSTGNIYNATGANLQTAIWSLNSTGGTVYLPIMTLTLTSQLLLSNIREVSIIGCGKNTSIQQGYVGSASASLMKFSNCRNIILRDVGLVGNGAGNGLEFNGSIIYSWANTIDGVYAWSFNGDGIVINNTQTSKIQNCFIGTTGKAGINLSVNSAHIEVTNCYFENENNAVYISGTMNNIKGLHMMAPQRCGIVINGYYNTVSNVIGDFYNGGTNRPTYGIEIKTGKYRNTFSDIIISDLYDATYGIYCNGYYNSFSNCMIQGYSAGHPCVNGYYFDTTSEENSIVNSNAITCTNFFVSLKTSNVFQNCFDSTGNPMNTMQVKAPTTPIAGSYYLNATTGELGIYTGTTWVWVS